MDEHDITNMWYELRQEHRLLSWTLRLRSREQLNRGVVQSAVGSCVPESREIHICLEWSKQTDPTEMREVFLHEIAHALMGGRAYQAAHGKAWRQQLYAIGGTYDLPSKPTSRLAHTVELWARRLTNR